MLETPGDGSGPDLPEWFMPPRMIGRYVTGPVPIARSGRLVIVARLVLAFPAGVEVEFEAQRAGPAPDPVDMAAAAAGPVTVICSWPGRVLPEARLVLDGYAIQVAVRQAQPLWPEPGS